MAYKIFLVEDETVTREGIRDNVDWAAVGFEYCGDASDGEIALPLIEEKKPDVIVTDIKMPFMDGLQLSKIIREHMPWIKIIILSGHDEFEYAQAAVKMGVWDYLLKPVDTKDLHEALKDVAAVLDQEKSEREKLKKLQDNIADNLVLRRQAFLLKLVMGGISTLEAIEQSQELGLDIVARYYVVGFINVKLCRETSSYDYQQYREIERMISGFVGNHLNILLTRKDMEELVLLFKGESKEQLLRDGIFLLQMVKESVENQLQCNLVTGLGSPKNRLGDLHRSFTESLIKVRSDLGEDSVSPEGILNQGDLKRLDHESIEDFLRFGRMSDFDDFYLKSLKPVCPLILKSNVIRHYVFVDILLTTTQFISDYGGDAAVIGLEFNELESMVNELNTTEEIEPFIKTILRAAIDFRDAQANSERTLIFQQAKDYVDEYYSDPGLTMSSVAEKYHFSPSYFSTIFRQEVGETFSNYLADLRINKAKTLLLTTTQKILEIAHNCGYKDAHYFSYVFRKNLGLSPQQFRDGKN